MATDGMETFVFFLYANIEWIRANPTHSPAQVGFDEGDGVNFYVVPGTETDDGVFGLTSSSNIGVDGMWGFKVSGTSVIPCVGTGKLTGTAQLCS